MTLLLADFRIRWPAFASVATYGDTLVDRVLQDAAKRAVVKRFGDFADEAQGNLAAHILSILTSTQGGAGGGRVVKSVTAGPATITYESGTVAGAISPSSLATTAYGLEYLTLLKATGPSGMVVI